MQLALFPSNMIPNERLGSIRMGLEGGKIKKWLRVLCNHGAGITESFARRIILPVLPMHVVGKL